MNTLFCFFSYYRPYIGLAILDVICALAVSSLELCFPMAIKAFVDIMLPTQDWNLIVKVSCLLFFIYLLNAILNGMGIYLGHKLGVSIETDMRRHAFAHIQKLSFRFYDNHETGKLVARITRNLEEVGELAHHGPEDLLLSIMTFFVSFILMIKIYQPLALIIILIVPIVFWITAHYGRRMMHNGLKIYDQIGDFNVRIEENVGGMHVVQSFTNESHENNIFATNNNNYRSTKLEAFRIMGMSVSLDYISMRLMLIITMLCGSYFILTNKLSVGGFLGFLMLVTLFFRPFEKINTIIEIYPKGIAGFRSYMELLSIKPDIIDRNDAIPAPHFNGKIRFCNVRFGYTEDQLILNNFNFNVNAGETVAIVGPSGVGKTTACSLISRFYDILDGTITIDDIDIRNITITSLRKQIGVVQQDVFLFGCSIRENIAYGRLDASETEIVDASNRARLNDFIATLPEGLDTQIGERGVKLSGGQKQRISIARIFLKNPSIIILDEATSALDAETEQEIHRSLTELSRGRTTLIIAHRLSTIRKANKIVEITKSGTAQYKNYDELIARVEASTSLYIM
ncbi:MAG: ABC transporter ATP-binding protein/permease [Rhodospirillaceae bacterium]|jgi:ATP-binding cassette subfamily B protein|nr:ABC transporter ATP-binding protein/permease [Rhodospirillaceae bacterium]